MKNTNRLGEIKYNTQGTPMKIISFINTASIEVEFIDNHKYKTMTTYNNFQRGVVMNPYDRTICGIGYIGDGKYRHNVKTTPFRKTMHNCWDDMIRRCYDENKRHVHPAYQNCYVSDIWHNYQDFALWYEQNYYKVGVERMHLDKDILYKNNKFYSPETCLIVPQRINMLFVRQNRQTDKDLPTGISRSGLNKYLSSYNGNSLGTYKTIEEALKYYNIAKHKHIVKVADEYKDKIPQKLYDALNNWIPDGISGSKIKMIVF